MLTSCILRTACRVIVPLALLFAFYSAMRGHNEPGGGFIAGLVAAVSICIYRMAAGPTALFRMIPIHPRYVVGIGLGLALLTAVTPLFFGKPFLYSAGVNLEFGEESLHLVSPMLFDLGVLLVVVGVAVGMISRLSEELEV